MERTVGVPHREIHIHSLVDRLSADLSEGVLNDFLSSRKRRITPILITEGTRQESGAIESPVKLSDSRLIIAIHHDALQFFLPGFGHPTTRVIELPVGHLIIDIVDSSLQIHETAARLDQQILSFLHIEGHPSHGILDAILYYG